MSGLGYLGKALCNNAVGLRLIRYDAKDRAHFCEPVIFVNGRASVDTVLRRAALSGRVEIDGEILNHQADVLTDDQGSWEQVIALDAKSYGALKNHWMRCKVEAVE